MDLPELDATIHQRTRLRILTLLHRNREASLAWVREELGLTYGNLDSHASKLEDAGYLQRGRRLTADGFEVRLRITEEGQRAFQAYLASLRSYLQAGEEAPAPAERADA